MGSEAATLFELDTKGICLLCLRKCSPSSCGISSILSSFSSGGGGISTSYYYSPEERERVFKSFKMLMRYLNIDLLKQCNFSEGFLQTVDGVQGRDIKMAVKMCSVCLEMCQEFSQIYKEFEMIRLQLDQCVQALLEVMQSGDKNKERVREYQRIIREETGGWNPLQLFHASIADNLRKETIRKCALRVENLIPRVSVSRPNNSNYQEFQPSTPPSPICVITETKGDLQNEDEFAGPISMLKVETVYVNGETSATQDDLIMDFDHPTSFKTKNDDEDPDATYYDPLSNSTIGFDDDNSPPADFDPPYRPNSSAVNFDCRYCSKKFNSSGNLRTHQMCAHYLDYFASRVPDGTTYNQLKAAIEYCTEQYKKIGKDPKGKPKLLCAFCTKVLRDTFNNKIHVLNNHFDQVLIALPNFASGYNSARVDTKTVALKRTAKKIPTSKRGRGGRRGRGRGRGSHVHVGGRSVKDDCGNPVYKCPACRKNFNTLMSMRRHHTLFHTIGSGDRHRCELCGKGFNAASNLKLHTSSAHLFEAYQHMLPEGTSKELLKATVVGISKEQTREKEKGSSGIGKKVLCNFCGKTNGDVFFFKIHLVDSHFQEVVNRLNDFKEAPSLINNPGCEEEDSSSSNHNFMGHPMTGENDDDEQQELPINNFANMDTELDSSGSPSTDHHPPGDDHEEVESQVNGEDIEAPPYQGSPKIVKTILKELLGQDEEIGGENGVDVPPVLDVYNASD